MSKFKSWKGHYVVFFGEKKIHFHTWEHHDYASYEMFGPFDLLTWNSVHYYKIL